MTTPRKTKSTAPVRSRVVIPERGRRPTGDGVAQAITSRVRAIRDRVGIAGPDASRVLKLSSRRFSDAIGISEKDLDRRLRTKNPTPFSPAELATICRVFGVRSDYLLLGDGPMLHGDIVVTEWGWTAPRRLSDLLYEHLVSVVGSQADQDRTWVAAFLPTSQDVLASVEAAVVDSVSAATEALVSDRRLANDSVRSAVAGQLLARTKVSDSPPEFFSDATAAALEGRLIDISRRRDKR